MGAENPNFTEMFVERVLQPRRVERVKSGMHPRFSGFNQDSSLQQELDINRIHVLEQSRIKDMRKALQEASNLSSPI